MLRKASQNWHELSEAILRQLVILTESYHIRTGPKGELLVVADEELRCPDCGGPVVYRDYVRRKVRSMYELSECILLPRVKCADCGKLHRVVPGFLLPYKQYEKSVIEGVRDGELNEYSPGLENLPGITFKRWNS